MGLFGRRDEYNEIYGNDNYNRRFGYDYDDVYDEDGEYVFCDCCETAVKWKDGKYLCPECGREFGRAEFFSYIGAEPPGIECLTCDNLYPGCIVCPHGYVEDDD